MRGDKLDENETLKLVSSQTMGTYYFPQVVEFKELQEQKARHCEKLDSALRLDSLGSVAVKTIDFYVPIEVPYINLAVPVQYKINAYRPLFENNYVPKHEHRLGKLRTGAEDELSQIESAVVETIIKRPSHKSIQSSPAVTTEAKTTEANRIVDLTPAKELHEPIDYPTMHVFVSSCLKLREDYPLKCSSLNNAFCSKNPAPGLISYEKTLPYSGCDLNYHLNPLPRFERDQSFITQKKFLDREVILGSVRDVNLRSTGFYLIFKLTFKQRTPLRVS
jgi:hypothetical protein